MSRTAWIPTVCAGVSYDFRYPVASSKDAQFVSPPSIANRSATQGPLLCFKIAFDPFPGVHYDIDVCLVDGNITEGSVLHALHDFFRSYLSPNDIGRLMALPYGTRFAIHNAFIRRVKDSNNPTLEAVGGYQFIDLLCEDTIFRGLELVVGETSAQWRLVLLRDWIETLSAYQKNYLTNMIRKFSVFVLEELHSRSLHRPLSELPAGRPYYGQICC